MVTVRGGIPDCEEQPMEQTRTNPLPISDASRTRSPSSSMLTISENGRYFVRDGAPFFWMGDTVWSLVNRYTPNEAEYYLERRRQQGFNVVHVMILFDGGPGLTTPAADPRNQPPFIDMNPATPNEAYFRNVDRVVRLAREKGFILVLLPCGGSSGSFVRVKPVITQENARPH